MIYSQEYDLLNYDPAAPVVEITVTNPHIPGPNHKLIALIDTGADRTMLPYNVIEAVNASFIETKQMRGITGHAIKVDTYLVTVQIGPFAILGVEAVALEQDSEAIIGRETINQLNVVLDGLSNTVTISQ